MMTYKLKEFYSLQEAEDWINEQAQVDYLLEQFIVVGNPESTIKYVVVMISLDDL